jgi:tetratricopeptide (TPR) repeat protein
MKKSGIFWIGLVCLFFLSPQALTAGPRESAFIYQNALRNFLKNADSYLTPAQEARLAGDGEKAAEGYGELLTYCDEKASKTVDPWVVLDYRGRALQGLGRLDEAEADLRQSIGLSASLQSHGHALAAPYYYLAWVYFDQNRVEEGLDFVEQGRKKPGYQPFESFFLQDPEFAFLKDNRRFINILGVHLALDGQDVFGRGAGFFENSDVFVSLSDFETLALAMGAAQADTVQDLGLDVFGRSFQISAGNRRVWLDQEEFELTAVVMPESASGESASNESASGESASGEAGISVSWLETLFDQETSFAFVNSADGTPYPQLNLEPRYGSEKYSREQMMWAQAAAWTHMGPAQAKADYLGGFPRSPSVKAFAAQTLLQDWGIEDRDGFLKTFIDLKYKGYSELYLDFGDSVDKMSDAELAKVKALNPKHRTRKAYEFYKKNKVVLLGRNLRALDLTRGVQLAGLGYLAGYGSFKETAEHMSDMARDLQRIYNSWEDMLEHALLGLEFVTGQSRGDRSSAVYKIDQFNRKEMKNPDSLWKRISWDFYLY